MSGLTYHKEPGGFLITLDSQQIGRLRYLDGGCRIMGIPWFRPSLYPTIFAARLALADALVEEEMLESE